MGVTGEGLRTGQRGRQGKSVVHFASWTPVSSPPARQGLTGQRDGATGGRLGFRRLPACHLKWLLPACRPGKHTSEPSGERKCRRPEASLSPCRAWSLCRQPRAHAAQKALPAPQADKGAVLWGLPARILLRGTARLSQARRSLPTGRDRKEPVFAACGHTMGCPPGQSVSISIS